MSDEEVKKNRQCFACNYANTPDNRDTCNYCGESFKVTDSGTMIADPKDPLYKGIPIQKLNINKLPDGWYKTNDSQDFLEHIKKDANPEDLLPRIYNVGENAGSFFVIMTGSFGAGLSKFMKKHIKDLQIFNLYNDHFFDEEADVHNPIGTLGLGFEKVIVTKKKRIKRDTDK